MHLSEFVNVLLKEVSRFSDEKLLGTPIFIRMPDGPDLTVADVDVKTENGVTVAYIDVGEARRDV